MMVYSQNIRNFAPEKGNQVAAATMM